MAKTKWKLIYKGDIESFDNSFHGYWKNKTTTKKFDEVRSLADQAMAIKGIDYLNVSRLLRTTAVLKRQ